MSAREYLGQQYLEVERFTRPRRDGSVSEIIVWQSACPECGTPFTCTTPATATTFKPNRRCQVHKRPGQRVRCRTISMEALP